MADKKIVPKRPTDGIAPSVRVPVRPQKGDIIPKPPQTAVSIRPRTPVSEDIRIVPRSSAYRSHTREADRAALAEWQQIERAHTDAEPANPVLREEQLHSVLERGDKKRAKKFAKALEAAREALAEARELLSEISVEKAIRRLEHEIAKAIKADGSLARTDLLAQIGTSEQELEMLPVVFFATVTLTPDGGWTAREPRRRASSATPATATLDVRGKSVEVVYLAGRPTVMPEPIPQIVPGTAIGATPTLVRLVDGSYRLELGDDQYLMQRQRMSIEGLKVEGEGENEVAADYTLVGEDTWFYYRLIDGNYDPTSPLLRTFGLTNDGRRVPTGFTSEPPSYGPAVLADYVQEPLWAITLKVGGRQVTIASVLMKGGNIVQVEVPWHDDLLEGEVGVSTLVSNQWSAWAFGLMTFDEAVNLHLELQAPAADPTQSVPSISA